MSHQDPNALNIRVPPVQYTLPDPARGIYQRPPLVSPATRPNLVNMPKSPLPAPASITLPPALASLSEHEKGKCEYLMSRLVEYGYPLVALTSIADNELRESLVNCLGQLLGDRVKLWKRVEELAGKNDTLQVEIGTLQRKVTEHRENMLAAIKKAEEQDSRASLQLKERDEKEKGLRMDLKKVERELAIVKKRDGQYKVECRKWENRCNDLQEKLQRLLSNQTKDSVAIEWLPVKAQMAASTVARTRPASTRTTSVNSQAGNPPSFRTGNSGAGVARGVPSASLLPSSTSNDIGITQTNSGTGSLGTLTASTIPDTGSLQALTNMLYDTHLENPVEAALSSLPKPEFSGNADTFPGATNFPNTIDNTQYILPVSQAVTRSPPSHASFTAKTTSPECWQPSTHDNNYDNSYNPDIDAISFPSHELIYTESTAQRLGTDASEYHGLETIPASAFEDTVEVSPFLVSDEEDEGDNLIHENDPGKKTVGQEKTASSQNSRRRWAVPDPNTFVLPRVNMQTPYGKGDRYGGSAHDHVE